MQSGTESSSSRAGLVIPLSPRGLCGMDSLSLEANTGQIYLPTYGPRHVEEIVKLTFDMPRAEQDVEAARGAEKKEARLPEGRKDLFSRRDLATQRLVSAFDRTEGKKLVDNPIFKTA